MLTIWTALNVDGCCIPAPDPCPSLGRDPGVTWRMTNWTPPRNGGLFRGSSLDIHVLGPCSQTYDCGFFPCVLCLSPQIVISCCCFYRNLHINVFSFFCRTFLNQISGRILHSLQFSIKDECYENEIKVRVYACAYTTDCKESIILQ